MVCPILKYAMTYLYFFLLNFWWDFYFFFQMYYSQFKSSMLFHDPLNVLRYAFESIENCANFPSFSCFYLQKPFILMHFLEKKLDIFTCLIGAQNMCTSASVFNIDVIS